MTRTTPLSLCPLAVLLGSLLQGQLLADTPLPPPRIREVWSPSKQFCAVMVPKPLTTMAYLWGGCRGLDAQRHCVVETVEGRKLVFAVTTGKPVPPPGDNPAAKGNR